MGQSGTCADCNRPMGSVTICPRCGRTLCPSCFGSKYEPMCADCIARAPRVELKFDYAYIRAKHWNAIDKLNKQFDRFKGEIDASETCRGPGIQRRVFYPNCVEDLHVLVEIMKIMGAENSPVIEAARTKLLAEG